MNTNTSIQNPIQQLGLEADTESITVSLPECIELGSEQWQVQLYAEGCLDCSCLVEGASEDYSEAKCHFSKGNVYCPADKIAIQFIGAKVRALKLIRDAQASGNSDLMLRRISDLSKLSLEARNTVLQELGLAPATVQPEYCDPEVMPEAEADGISMDDLTIDDDSSLEDSI